MLTAAIFVKFEWSPTGKPVAARRKVPAFAETLRAGRRYGTQAWSPAAGMTLRNPYLRQAGKAGPVHVGRIQLFTGDPCTSNGIYAFQLTLSMITYRIVSWWEGISV